MNQNKSETEIHRNQSAHQSKINTLNSIIPQHFSQTPQSIQSIIQASMLENHIKPKYIQIAADQINIIQNNVLQAIQNQTCKITENKLRVEDIIKKNIKNKSFHEQSQKIKDVEKKKKEITAKLQEVEQNIDNLKKGGQESSLLQSIVKSNNSIDDENRSIERENSKHKKLIKMQKEIEKRKLERKEIQDSKMKKDLESQILEQELKKKQLEELRRQQAENKIKEIEERKKKREQEILKQKDDLAKIYQKIHETQKKYEEVDQKSQSDALKEKKERLQQLRNFGQVPDKGELEERAKHLEELKKKVEEDRYKENIEKEMQIKQNIKPIYHSSAYRTIQEESLAKIKFEKHRQDKLREKLSVERNGDKYDSDQFMDTKTKKIKEYVKNIPKPIIDEAKREELEKHKHQEHQRSVDFKEYLKLSEKVKSMKDPLFNKKNHIPSSQPLQSEPNETPLVEVSPRQIGKEYLKEAKEINRMMHEEMMKKKQEKKLKEDQNPKIEEIKQEKKVNAIRQTMSSNVRGKLDQLDVSDPKNQQLVLEKARKLEEVITRGEQLQKLGKGGEQLDELLVDSIKQKLKVLDYQMLKLQGEK